MSFESEIRRKALIRPLQVEVDNLGKLIERKRVERKQRLIQERIDRITNRIEKTW